MKPELVLEVHGYNATGVSVRVYVVIMQPALVFLVYVVVMEPLLVFECTWL